MGDAEELEDTNSITESSCQYPQNEEAIHKSTKCLEIHSLIDFVETDGEFIVSAGKDHEIKVWDAEKEILLCRLSGHNGPVTGLKFLDTPSHETSVVVSASEDGTIRQWSLPKGEELMKLETAHIITCMGIMANKMVVTGNHIGYLEIHHLATGQLYSSIAAHIDEPINSLMVYGIYICTAVLGKGSLRVWKLKWGKMMCLYCLEDRHSIEFSTFTVYDETLILGAAKYQQLVLINYSEDEKTLFELKEGPGQVQHIKVMEKLLLATTANEQNIVFLHVYDISDFEQLALITCGTMGRISAMTLIIRCTKLKIIVGGTALAMYVLELPPDIEDSFRKNYEEPCEEGRMVTVDGKEAHNNEKDNLGNTVKNYTNHDIEAQPNEKGDLGIATENYNTNHDIEVNPNENSNLGNTIKNYDANHDIEANPSENDDLGITIKNYDTNQDIEAKLNEMGDLGIAINNYDTNHDIAADPNKKDNLENSIKNHETNRDIEANPNENGDLGIAINNYDANNDIEADPNKKDALENSIKNHDTNHHLEDERGDYELLNILKTEIIHGDTSPQCNIKNWKKIHYDKKPTGNTGPIKLPPINDSKNLIEVELCEKNHDKKFAENVQSEKSKLECIQMGDGIDANTLEKETEPGNSMTTGARNKTDASKLCRGKNKTAIKEEEEKIKYGMGIKNCAEQSDGTNEQLKHAVMQAPYQKPIIKDKQSGRSKKNSWMKISTKKKQQDKVEKSQQKKDKDCNLM